MFISSNIVYLTDTLCHIEMWMSLYFCHGYEFCVVCMKWPTLGDTFNNGWDYQQSDFIFHMWSFLFVYNRHDAWSTLFWGFVIVGYQQFFLLSLCLLWRFIFSPETLSMSLLTFVRVNWSCDHLFPSVKVLECFQKLKQFSECISAAIKQSNELFHLTCHYSSLHCFYSS